MSRQEIVVKKENVMDTFFQLEILAVNNVTGEEHWTPMCRERIGEGEIMRFESEEDALKFCSKRYPIWYSSFEGGNPIIRVVEKAVPEGK